MFRLTELQSLGSGRLGSGGVWSGETRRRAAHVFVAALLMVVLLGAVAPGAVAAQSGSASTCARLIASTDRTLGGSARDAVAAYRTACRLKAAGLRGDALRAVVARAAEVDPTVAPPADLLAADTSQWISTSHALADVALALVEIAGLMMALVIGLLFVATMIFRATLGRSRAVRNLLGFRPSVIVEANVSGANDELKTLPALLQSVLGNLGNDVGGQSIQFVSPSSDDVSEVALPASAPPQLEYLTWLMALLRPLAPKDRVTLRLAVQPEGRQGIGLTATLVGGHKGRTINATTLWEAELGLGGMASEEPVVSERERYQLLVAPLGAWVYFTLADLTQQDAPLLGTRNWRSYGLFALGCRLYQTHRQRGQRLLREAIDADPANLGAHLNILLLEFDSRRTDAGKRQLVQLRAGVEALPAHKLCARSARRTRKSYWYDSTWYRTMYSLTAVCSHMVSAASTAVTNGTVGNDALTPADIEHLRVEGQTVAMELVGACWIALNDVLGDGGQPAKPRTRRGRKGRSRFRQCQELALFLAQMLPSSVLLLVNLQLLDRASPVVGTLSPGSPNVLDGPPDRRRQEWNRRGQVLGALAPTSARASTCPSTTRLLTAIDPVDFLPARARYNVACVHSEVAQYQDRHQPGAEAHAARSRHMALLELAKGLDHDSGQWAREDPALWEVRTNHATRPRFADLLAAVLCSPLEWAILSELPFIGVAGASRLWIGGNIRDAASLCALSEGGLGALLDNPSPDPWLRGDEVVAWVRRASLRARLAVTLGDPDLVDRIEDLLHVLGITTRGELASWPSSHLSEELRALATADEWFGGRLTPSAVEVWSR